MLQLIRSLTLMMAEMYSNLGIALGLTFGVLLVLRPILVRVLRPKYRVAVWMVTWMSGWSWSFYEMPGYLCLLPVTFRGWIAPRVMEGRSVPGYIPALLSTGEKTITLPGGGEIPVTFTPAMQNVLAVAMIAGFWLTLWWVSREEKTVRRLIRQGEPMSREWHEAHGISNPMIEVRIMEGLPTSFVYRGNMKENICLQKELPEDRMELILRHEMTHIKHHHVWFKGMLIALMAFYWWNPVMWVAYRLACRDMELACDEAVLKDLDEHQRREYARMLVELGSGRQLWGGVTCFGESDAAIRVRRSVNWKGEGNWARLLVWPALALAFLFFFTSPNGTRAQRDAAWERYVAEELTGDFITPRFSGREGEILEVRVDRGLDDHNLLILTDNGRWHLCKVKWYPARNGYQISSSKWVTDADKYQNFVPLESWG